jgi:hypothetical protein
LPTPTTATMPFRPGPCTPTCAGATPTPATLTCWPPNDESGPASAVRRASAGADARSPQQPDEPVFLSADPPNRRTRSPKSPPGR